MLDFIELGLDVKHKKIKIYIISTHKKQTTMHSGKQCLALWPSNIVIKNNKLPKNFDKGPHRRCIVPTSVPDPQKCHFLWGYLKPQPMQGWLCLRVCAHPNNISIGLSVSAQFTRVPNTHTHTDRHYTDISRCVQHLQQRAASTHRVWAIRQRMSVTIVPGKLKSFTVDSLGLFFLYSTGYGFHRCTLNFSQDRNIFHPVTVNFDL